MARRRVSIPKKLAADVLFASDNTCCVCRDKSKGVQIHHIDSVPSNNTIDNLAALCLDHHDSATRGSGLTRNLSPEAVTLFNKSWRDIVKVRLMPDKDSPEFNEYRQEVFLEISLTCHSWKIEYMRLYPGGFLGPHEDNFEDIWDLMIQTSEHHYSEEEWKKYFSLFSTAITNVIQQVDSLSLLHSEILPVPFKTLLIRTKRRLRTEAKVYTSIPMLAKLTGNGDGFFGYRFTEIGRILSQLAREADRLREEITSTPAQ